MSLPAAVTSEFTKALPKVELHAHLTGSLSVEGLHQIWLRKQAVPGFEKLRLADPLVTIRPEGVHHDVFSFFHLFDTYIYALIDDIASVQFATSDVLRAFHEDGVQYLELRTTPRDCLATGLSKEVYVNAVLGIMEQQRSAELSACLILSVDRRNTLAQAMETVDLAIKYKHRGVVGVDLCGNPLKGDVATLEPAFRRARDHGLRITLHFAEVRESSTIDELRTLLSYRPDRLGHVIHVPEEIEQEILARHLGLELCISCNVHAKLTLGGFTGHHFGKWYSRECPVALCTDDVGIFGSPVSNEYLIAAENFGLSRQDLINLSRRTVPMIFGGTIEKERMLSIIDRFQSETSSE